MNKIIGISGVAGAGKDTFYSLLSQSMPCKRFSLADELKKEVNQWCRSQYGIDSVSCTREEKELIREFLVFHGTFKRNQTQGRHWIEKLHESIASDKSNNLKVITDIRYDDYENDEVSWLKNELNGILIHVSMYTEFEQIIVGEEKASVRQGGVLRKFKAPINSEEQRNDPNLKDKSDFQVEWPFIPSGQTDELSPYVDGFVKWLIEN